MALLFVLSVFATGLLTIPFPGSAAEPVEKAIILHRDGLHSSINLDHFLMRLSPGHRIAYPSDLIDLPATEFEPVVGTRSPGYTPLRVWYRAPLIIEDAGSGPGSISFIELGAAYLNDIRLLILSDRSRNTVWEDRVGDHIPSKPDIVPSLKHVAEWPKLAPGRYWLLIGVRTNSAHLFSATLYPEAELISNAARKSFVDGSFLGLMMVAFAVYLTFGALSRDTAVIWYAVYVLSLFMVNFGVSGYAQLLLKDVWIYASDAITGGGTALAIGSSIAMWSHIIQLNRYNRFLYRVMTGFAIACIVCGVTATSDYYIHFAKLFFFPHVCLMIVMFGYLVGVGYREHKLGALSFYIFALGVPSIAASIQLLMLLGVMPVNAFTTSAYPVSSILHIVMVGLAMGYRTHNITHQWIDAYQTSKRANRLAGEQRTFITMLSHEFRTPLAIIQRSAEILGLHLREETAPIHNRLATIRSNARQLSGLVDAFLTKETLDSANFVTKREPVQIDRFLQDLVARRLREVPDHAVSVSDTEFAIVEIDKILIEQALLNLIENARKYAPGAHVRVACNRAGDGHVYIRVMDDGPGIPPEDLARVSNAYFRGQRSSSTQGVGLGLHITSRIVEAHNGEMSISVGEHGGTTILIKVPYDREGKVLNRNLSFISVRSEVLRKQRGEKQQ